MSGLTGLVDTLVADKLAQRPDLVRLPSASVVPGLDPAVQVAAVANDVRIRTDSAPAHNVFAAAPPVGTAAPVPAEALSVAARAISAVLAELVESPGPVAGRAPLAPHGAATAPQALASSLAAALSGSGLFYESHLAGLAAGLLQPADLEREPQARLPAAEAVPTARGESGPAAETAGTHPERAQAQGIVHPQARAIVSQQLDLLASGVFQWRGEAWPGVPMEWRVEEDREGEDGEAGTAAARWATTFSLAMPDLGPVQVRLSLHGAALTATLEADAAAAARLRERAGDLQEQLAAVGLHLPRLAVETRELP